MIDLRFLDASTANIVLDIFVDGGVQDIRVGGVSLTGFSPFAGFAAGEDDVPVEEADLEAFSDVVFAIGVEPSSGTAEYLFDVERGRVVSSSQQSTVRTRWRLQTPDATTGEPTGFELALDIDRRADFRSLDD
jgi:curli biogenesis system outer membrane secretion channel CsgG